MNGFFNTMARGARFNTARTHRYILWRVWRPTRPYVMFIGLNPSTADEHVDDATIKKCVRYAQRWDYGGLYMANLFAWRATKPTDIPPGELCLHSANFRTIAEYARDCRTIVAAWGAHPAAAYVGTQLCNALERPIHVLRLTAKTRVPEHPLYVPGDVKPVPWYTPAKKSTN
jgi:hypothetical protein